MGEAVRAQRKGGQYLTKRSISRFKKCSHIVAAIIGIRSCMDGCWTWLDPLIRINLRHLIVKWT